MPTQEKKKNNLSNPQHLTPQHFRRWGGLNAHTRKKTLVTHGIFAAGGGQGAHTRKKTTLVTHPTAFLPLGGGGAMLTQEKKRL